MAASAAEADSAGRDARCMEPGGAGEERIPREVPGARLRERRLRAVVQHPTRTLRCARFQEVDPKPPWPRRDAGDINAVTGQEVTGTVPEVVVGKCRDERRIDAQPSERDGDVRLATAEGRVEGPRGCEADAVRRREPQHDLPKSDDASSRRCGHFRGVLRALEQSIQTGAPVLTGRGAKPEERDLVHDHAP